jgi:hypothetical protein
MAKPALKDYSDDPTVSAFETIDDLVAPKPSAMTGIRPDLQPNVVDYSPYSLDPTINAFNPMEAIGEAFGGQEQKLPPRQQGNPYVGQALEQMFKLRQGAQATGLSTLDLPLSLPGQIAGAVTYGASRFFGGADPERAQQLSEYASTPLSYLQPGKLATMTTQPIGQGTEAYAASPISKLGEFITNYGAQPAIDMLVKQGMAPQDAQQLVTNAPLLVYPGYRLGKLGVQTAKNIPEWARELKTPEAARIEPQMDVNQTPQPPVNANQMPQSVGAAQATPAAVLQGNIDAAIANASPELQAHIRSKPLESVNVPALEIRSLEEKHGINLTTGQRTGDTQLYSQEWNKRGETPMLGSHFEAQPQQISTAFENTKQRHAPDISSTADASELGQYQINALAAKDASRQQAITGAYQKLTDANGGQFPIDVSALQGNITSQLSKNLKTNHLPDSINADMRDFYKNPTFEAYESLRTNLANEMRSNSNGNSRAAAYIVRNELEKLPVFGEGTGNPLAIQLKQLADDARSLVKERYSILNNNPAYKAAVKEFGSLTDAASQGESLNAANFHKKFVANGTPESIRRMKSEIPTDDIAQQAITFAELERAKSAAVNASERNLTPEQFAKFLKSNKAGLRESLPPQAMQDVIELGLLTSKIGMPKAGTFNYSNTFSSQLADMAKQGLLTAAEAKLASATMGASIPAMGLTRQFMQKLNKEGFAKQATNPVGGLTKD